MRRTEHRAQSAGLRAKNLTPDARCPAPRFISPDYSNSFGTPQIILNTLSDEFLY
jgi:hypothetical protein